MSETKVIPCSCKHEYQDERYGKGNRVFNFGPKVHGALRNPGWRCTVCERTKGE